MSGQRIFRHSYSLPVQNLEAVRVLLAKGTTIRDDSAKGVSSRQVYVGADYEARVTPNCDTCQVDIYSTAREPERFDQLLAGVDGGHLHTTQTRTPGHGWLQYHSAR